MKTAKQWEVIRKIETLNSDVLVEFDCYGEDDRKKLEKSTAFPKGTKFKGAYRIPVSHFLGYWLIGEFNPDDEFRSSIDAMRENGGDALFDLRSNFLTDGQTLQSRYVPQRHADIAERIGHAVGLSISDYLAGTTTKADWTRIEITHDTETGAQKERFDFMLSSTGIDFLAVEAKGRLLSAKSKRRDNRNRSSISEARQKIEVKKVALRGHTDYRAVSLMGTIVAADERNDTVLKCWLTDPVAFVPNIPPDSFRVATRLRYYLQLIQAIFPRWRVLTDEVSQRISEIVASGDWKRFDRSPIRYRSGGVFRVKSKLKLKPQTADDRFVGTLEAIDSRWALFVGLDRKILSILATQALAYLHEFSAGEQSNTSMLEWTPKEDEHAFVIECGGQVVKGADGIAFAKIPCTLHQTSDGLAFALIRRRRPRTRERKIRPTLSPELRAEIGKSRKSIKAVLQSVTLAGAEVEDLSKVRMPARVSHILPAPQKQFLRLRN